jgi:hypothetical protein
MPMWQAPAPFSRRPESGKKCFEVRNHRQTDLFHSRSFFTDNRFAVAIRDRRLTPRRKAAKEKAGVMLALQRGVFWLLQRRNGM